VKKYFMNDPENGVSVYSTLKDATDALNEVIHDGRFDEGWPLERDMENYFVGEITHIATQVDYMERPPQEELDEEDCDKNGVHWTHEFDSTCNYKVLPIGEKSV
jgi:hypothetical protein